eukprot:Gregarina_sp_Poly_1__496@NODE_111_length_13906_cov_58_362887_g98_i0_p7_GENE_NODE_111_length_13906_cov_58_362887_g98_i0NODE_111_length_13906_cov_58_362887_g98_i0_p7_ORF_typecomplete_len174_score38_87Tho1_MOS11_C/PF18592_1/0_0029Tho1_MOS11_C/PF18592_1/0_1Tho1_MOS11_C/PF18592_1/7_3e09DUF3106/PF11304_8/0_059DUF3106/PF11304_8/29UreE_N/PF02814_15/2e03UreE_N/PF02814_15/4_3e02UreE_N/PF02814_15/0_89_NODE_111_length_13906_cov_58_362887_g98_i043184839
MARGPENARRKNRRGGNKAASNLKVQLAPADKEKIASRAERFGTHSDEQKAKLRAARFGTFNSELEQEKAKKRQRRFAVPDGAKGRNAKIGTLENTPEERERRKKRAERFGVPCAELDADKRKKRVHRFGLEGGIDFMNKHLTSGSTDEAAAVSDIGIDSAGGDKEEGLIEEK